MLVVCQAVLDTNSAQLQADNSVDTTVQACPVYSLHSFLVVVEKSFETFAPLVEILAQGSKASLIITLTGKLSKTVISEDLPYGLQVPMLRFSR